MSKKGVIEELIWKLRGKLRYVVISIKDSYLLRILLINFLLVLFFSYIYAIYEGTSFWEALFYNIVYLFTDFPRNPQTHMGKISSLIVMAAGFIFFASIVGKVSEYLIQRFMNRNKVKLINFYSGENHIVICNINSKIDGILREFRSDSLSHFYPVVIISPDVDKLTISENPLRRDVYGIKDNAFDRRALERANLEKARSILVLSDDRIRDDLYADTEVTLVYRTICDYLCSENVVHKIKRNINIVLEYQNNRVNLLPCSAGLLPKLEVYHQPLKDTSYYLIVEPIFMERMSTYLLVQSIFEKDINEVIQRLVTAQLPDTNEFYYVSLPTSFEDKCFYDLKRALIDEEIIPIGVIREKSTGHKESAITVELVLNPTNDFLLRRDDKIVMISYSEEESNRIIEKLWRKHQERTQPPPESSLPLRRKLNSHPNWNTCYLSKNFIY